MEAWEELSPELPPGWRIKFNGGNLAILSGDGTMFPRCGAARGAEKEAAWRHFGITRKAYAELIAPGLVRKAATRHIEEQTVVLMAMDVFGRFEFEVTDGGFCSFAQGKGPDICTAALATIRALGGGE